MLQNINISKLTLKELYEKERLTTFQIAIKLNCCQATIWKKIKEYKIKTRLPGVRRVNIEKGELEDLYINKKLSTWKIEKILKISRGTIHRKLKEFNITCRNLSDSHIIYPRTNFSQDFMEKAYLIGFRLGDLGVRKIYPNSKTICVASGSTKKSQIDLIKNLFEGYGRIWIKKKNDKINIQVSLNESFDFLLDNKIAKWILFDKDYFFSFLSGFSDAEGSIKIYKNQAVYSLGNYDFNLLKIIKTTLKKYKIGSGNIFVDNRKGKKNSEGYVYRSNYCSLKITKKSDLTELFLEFKKYLKHKDKLKDLNIAMNNLAMRKNEYKKKTLRYNPYILCERRSSFGICVYNNSCRCFS